MRYFEIKIEVEKATDKTFFGLFNNFKKVSSLTQDEMKASAENVAAQFAKDHSYNNAKVEQYSMRDGLLIVRVSVE